jgi:hypothetical protein
MAMRAVALGVVGVGLAGLLLWLGVGGVGSPTRESTPRSPPKRLEYGYHPRDYVSFPKVWVRGCVGTGETVAYCQCAIDKYMGRLHAWELNTASAIARSGGTLAELPKHTRKVVKHVERTCR